MTRAGFSSDTETQKLDVGAEAWAAATATTDAWCSVRVCSGRGGVCVGREMESVLGMDQECTVESAEAERRKCEGGSTDSEVTDLRWAAGRVVVRPVVICDQLGRVG